MKHTLAVLAAGLASIAMGSAHAVAIPTTHSTTAGTTYTTPALTGFTTNGAQMVGSKVTVKYASGATDTKFWAATGATSGAATGTDWSLSLAGDSFGGSWILAASGREGIVGFTFDGQPGDTIFDVKGDAEYSPGSALGMAFSNGDSLAGLSAHGTYSNQLQLGGTLFGDLFVMLSVDISGGQLVGGQSMTFNADTDNAAAKGSITPTIPEPETYALMLAGLAAVGWVARRRKA
jgi:hypothetical protein